MTKSGEKTLRERFDDLASQPIGYDGNSFLVDVELFHALYTGGGRSGVDLHGWLEAAGLFLINANNARFLQGKTTAWVRLRRRRASD